MLDALLKGAVIALTHDKVDVTGVVVNQRLPQRREIRGWRVVGLAVFHWQKDHGFARLQPATLSLHPSTRGLTRTASQIETFGHDVHSSKFVSAAKACRVSWGLGSVVLVGA